MKAKTMKLKFKKGGSMSKMKYQDGSEMSPEAGMAQEAAAPAMEGMDMSGMEQQQGGADIQGMIMQFMENQDPNLAVQVLQSMATPEIAPTVVMMIGQAMQGQGQAPEMEVTDTTMEGGEAAGMAAAKKGMKLRRMMK